jgi:hypothetical protein
LLKLTVQRRKVHKKESRDLKNGVEEMAFNTFNIRTRLDTSEVEWQCEVQHFDSLKG